MANNTKAFYILLIIGISLRLLFINQAGFKFDVDAWAGWSQRLVELGFNNFYSEQVWTNYTPGYLYVLYFLGLIKELLQLDYPTFFHLLKLPSIIAEIFLAIFVYRLLITQSKTWALISSGFIFLNPSLIFNSAIWGQVDGLFSLFLVLFIFFLNREKIIISSIILGISILIKPQAILLAPVIVLFLFRKFSIKTLLNLFAPAALLITFLSLPFFTKSNPTQIINLIYQMTEDYPYISLFAYNFWGIFGFWIPDTNTILDLTYKNLGYLLYGVYWLVIIYFNSKRKLSIFTLAALAALSFYFLPTRIHERYLYPSLIFLIILSSIYKSYLLIFLTGLLSVIHFANLHYVYIYYNEMYLNLPKVLYNTLFYNFLNSNSKIISAFSFLLFILITISIIKNEYVTKKN